MGSLSIGVVLAGTLAANSWAAATVHRSSAPIKDVAGRVEVIVDFDFDPDTDREFDEAIADAEYKPWSGHRSKAIKFLNQFQKKHGVERSGMTSWTTTSLTAYVTSKQLDAIVRDKRVTLVTENESQRYSAFSRQPIRLFPGRPASLRLGAGN